MNSPEENAMVLPLILARKDELEVYHAAIPNDHEARKREQPSENNTQNQSFGQL